MRAAVVHRPGDLALVEVQEPAPSDYEALVQMLTCTLCNGTDTKILAGHFHPEALPGILGHESIGRVVAVGRHVRSYRPGDLVLRPTAVFPGRRLGGYLSCFGAFAERGLVFDAAAFREDHPPREHSQVPAWSAMQQVVPADFDPDLAGTFITFKETLSFLHDLGLRPQSSVLILGSGPVGLSFLRSAKLLGAGPVIVLGRRDERLEVARRFGADGVVNTAREDPVQAVRALTGGRGADLVVEAVGDTALLEQAVYQVAAGGEIAVYGIAPEQRATLEFGRGRTAGRFSVRFAGPREPAVHAWALDALRQGFVDLDSFVTHRLPLTEIAHAFELLRGGSALKVVLRLDA